MNLIGLFRSGSSAPHSGGCSRCLQLGMNPPFPVSQAKFEFYHGDYEKQCLHALSRKDKAGTVMNNPSQSVFLFMDRQHLQVNVKAAEIAFRAAAMPKTPDDALMCFLQTPKTKATVFKLCSLCLYLPQDQLTCWGVGGIEDHLRPYMPD